MLQLPATLRTHRRDGRSHTSRTRACHASAAPNTATSAARNRATVCQSQSGGESGVRRVSDSARTAITENENEPPSIHT